MTTFDTLEGINVNSFTEKKKSGNTELTYLSWPYAWAEVKKRFPEAHYEIEKFNGLPYVYDPQTGYMVYTTVTIDGITHEMWLPVMDGANKAMKSEPYTYTTRFGEKSVEAATMFDVNKTIMRCLVKNLAMFGLGLYIYAGEDLPLSSDEVVTKTKAEEHYADVRDAKIDNVKVVALTNAAHDAGVTIEQILQKYGISTLGDMTEAMFYDCNKLLDKQKKMAAKA